MKSRGVHGLVLALVVLVCVNAAPSSAAAPKENLDISAKARVMPGRDVKGSGIATTTEVEPSTESLNGDPEDWLGGQNWRSGKSELPSDLPDHTLSVEEQIKAWWQTFLSLMRARITS